MKKERLCDLLLVILIFIGVLSTILIKQLDSLDELWNYNFAKNIANGLVPYRDFNMVVTPLLSFICAIILKITFDELVVMRMLATILCTTILYITYKLFLLLNIKREFSVIFTFFIFYLFRDIFCIDYNYGSLLLILIIIYLEIKLYKKDYKFIKVSMKNDMLLGILAGLAVTTKQTSGLLICLVLLANKLPFIRKKEEWNIYIKSLIYRLIGIIIPVSVLIIYLLLNNAFNDFMNYAIFGILEFNNTQSYRTLIHFNLIGILSILVPITFVYEWTKSILLGKNIEEYFLCFYGLAIFSICIPISNVIHFLIGSLPIIIVIIYKIYNWFKKNKNKILKNIKLNNNIIKTSKYLIIFLFIFYIILNFYKYCNLSDDYSYCSLKHFKYIPVHTGYEKCIKHVAEYVKNNENIIILDPMATMITIPTDKYHRDYDMLNVGNLGFRGEERIINDIANSENIKYLIIKEGYENWQVPENIIDYVKRNKMKVGEIEIFDIYK